MVQKLYSEFDADITILPAEGKTFRIQQVDYSYIQNLPEIKHFSNIVKGIVVLRHENKWVNATMMGVDSSFLKLTDMDEHMLEGSSYLYKDELPKGIIGATLLDKLDGYIPEKGGEETITIYSPKNNIKMRPGSNPFNTRLVALSGRMAYNRDINSEKLVVPFEFAKEVFGMTDEISEIAIRTSAKVDSKELKKKLEDKLGSQFKVQTNYEAFELIYKTSETEKLILIFFLFFVFILASFNLVASITMLFIEKKDNLATMLSFGANKNFIFKIFFFEGLFITLRGVVFGAILGYGVCLAQVYGKFIVMPNSFGEPFPLTLNAMQGIVILFLIIVFSLVISYLPVKYLIKKNLANKI